MSGSADLARVLARTGPILLDFDGPVCSIFAGYPASAVADDLREVIARVGIDIPADIVHERDPLAVLRWTATAGRPELPGIVDDALQAAELRAVETAEPTPYAREVIVAAHQGGRPVAIVSNNSAPAIEAYLDRHRLGSYVAPVIGRTHSQPERMKPDPASVLQAAAALKVKPAACVLLGDSVTDILAALAAGAATIGFANKRPKSQALAEAGAHALVESLSDVAAGLLRISLKGRTWSSGSQAGDENLPT